ncbi:hypothetical protein [Dolichospermum flos-aquae]|uniref:hypothetical protein n=1 Tax=Dolichospermum flosaquae TaxID=1166 RepID=UPI001B36220B|nr:hypothetical protein [Dolichospermum flos-aquae]
MKIKKHSIRLVNYFRHFVYLSLWLTLPSLLLGTTISVNSASAADDMVAANLNNDLITDKTATTTSLADTKRVFTAADLKPIPVNEINSLQIITNINSANIKA